MQSLMNMMFYIIGAVLVIQIVITVFAVALRKSKHKIYFSEPWPFESVKLLSRPEQVLYFRLVKALPEYLVFSQVQISRLMKVKKGVPSQQWRNRIDRLSADFVICSKDSSIVAVIELDDASHDREHRKKTDFKKDHALKSANIRVIRFKVLNMPDDVVIRELFHQKKPD